MCGPRQSEAGRRNRQEAEVVDCCEYEWLSCGRVLDQLKHAEQRNVIAAELLAARTGAAVRGITVDVCRRG